MTRDQFVSNAINIWKDRYDYSKVVYINAITPVCIICPIIDGKTMHGDFWTRPSAHTHKERPNGCPKCAMKKSIANQKNEQKFTDESNIVHKNKYDYSKVEYHNNKTPVCVICHEIDPFGMEHGEFWPAPGDHLKGSGCPKCYSDKRHNGKSPLDNFKYHANEIFHDKYDYSKAVYVNDKTPICVTCPVEGSNGESHGDFWPTPLNHVRHQTGCPKCAKQSFSVVALNWLNDIEKKENIKIQKADSPQGEEIIYACDFNMKTKYYKKLIKLDGICHDTLTVYEFHGCYYHGCPKCFPKRDNICINGKTHEENYQRTLEKEKIIENIGFYLVTIWECEYRNSNQN